MNNQKPADDPLPTDQQLWQAFKQGDKEAYAQIYHLQIRGMFHYGMSIGQDRDLVKDCIHDLFYYLWEHRPGLGETDNIRRYLYTALRREIIVQLKRTSQSATPALPTYAAFTPAFETEWIEQQTTQRNCAQLREAIRALPRRQQEAVFFKYYQEMDGSEIAEVMHIHRRAVYKLLGKAIRNLRRWWAG